MDQYVERRDGGYSVAGTRITLDFIVLRFRNGASPESLYRSFPAIGSLEKVYGAITFYLANKVKVEDFLADQERLTRDAAGSQTPIPSPLAEKLRRARNEAVPGPS